MKPLEKHSPLHIRLPAVRLYRDDIETVIDLMHQNGLSVRIADATHGFDSLDDMKNHRGNQPGRIVIEGVDPKDGFMKTLTIELNASSETSVMLYRNSKSLESAWLHIQTHLRTCHRWHQKCLNPWFSFYAFSIVILPAIGFAPLLNYEHLSKFLSHVLLPTAAVHWVLSMLWRWRYPRIFLDRQHEATNFVKRNLDTIIVALVSAIITAFVTKFFS